MKRVVILGLLLALAACGTKSPETTVFQLRAGYAAAVLTPAAHYAQLPTCATAGPAVCKKPEVVTALQKADAAAKAALDAAEDTVRNHPTVDASFAISAATNAVHAATQIITVYGVR